MNPVLTPYKPGHFPSINDYFPLDWNFDFREFLIQHLNRDYFRGFSLLLGSDPIGFGNLMVFGTVCWIGNIVVSEKHRKKGFGTKITEFLVQEGRKLGATTLNLVATELGQPIYEKLGFRTECMYKFFKRKSELPELEITGQIRKAHQSDFPGIFELDHHTTGENRDAMINFFRESTCVMKEADGKLQGYYIEELGDGFIAAEDPEAGIELLKKKVVSSDRQIVLPGSNDFAKDFLLDCGFKKTMELPRMTLGKKSNWKPECIFSRGTGYCG